MEKQVIFRERQEFPAADANAIQQYVEQSQEDLINDAISGQPHYAGLLATRIDQNNISIAVGRYYNAGLQYLVETTTALNLLNFLPIATQKYVAVVVTGVPIQTNVQPRDFLVDPTSGSVEPQAVPMESLNQAQISVIGGAESSQPNIPPIPQGQLMFALVLLGTTGIISIIMQGETTGAPMPSLEDHRRRLNAIEADLSTIKPAVSSISTDLMALRLASLQKADRRDLIVIGTDLALVKKLLKVPAYSAPYDADDFVDTSKSNSGGAGYAARIYNGLVFPDAASAQSALALFNPIDPSVSVHNSLVLPAYTSEARLKVSVGFGGGTVVTQYPAQSLPIITRKPCDHRWGYGNNRNLESRWLVSHFREAHDQDSDWDRGEHETNGLPDSEFLHEKSVKVYKDDTTTAINASHIGQTFLNSVAMWLTQVGLHFTSLAGSGDVTVSIMEALGDKPDPTKVVATVNVPWATLKVHPIETVVPLNPVLLEAGKRYVLTVSTGAAHQHGYCVNSSEIDGTFWFANNSGDWTVVDPTKKMMITLYGANFAQTRTEVVLQSPSLGGGITDMDIATASVVPDGTDFHFEIQVGGIWYRLDDGAARLVGAATNLVPVRAVMVGTSKLAPAFKLAANAITVRMCGTTLTHWSASRAVPSTTNITVLVLLSKQFNPTYDSIACTIKNLTNAAVNPDVTSHVVNSDGTFEYTFHFTPTAITSYAISLQGAWAGPGVPFAILERMDTAQ